MGARNLPFHEIGPLAQNFVVLRQRIGKPARLVQRHGLLEQTLDRLHHDAVYSRMKRSKFMMRKT
jgi:hypothetical protein